jgi:single-strand DNA-binding protein
MSVNTAILIGHLGKDPELRQTQSGTSVASVTLATSERYKDKSGNRQESTEWHNLVAWGKTGELLAKYCRKGSQVYVTGRITNRKYTDRSGQDKYISEIVVRDVQFLDSKGSNAPTERTAERTADVPAESFLDNPPSADGVGDDLPF